MFFDRTCGSAAGFMFIESCQSQHQILPYCSQPQQILRSKSASPWLPQDSPPFQSAFPTFEHSAPSSRASSPCWLSSVEAPSPPLMATTPRLGRQYRSRPPRRAQQSSSRISSASPSLSPPPHSVDENVPIRRTSAHHRHPYMFSTLQYTACDVGSTITATSTSTAAAAVAAAMENAFDTITTDRPGKRLRLDSYDDHFFIDPIAI